ncbi:MAG: hypothetical protein JSW26_30395 [Desulfobacterales bacterium]|nr:MAG: hypothetical protein JSW26_30395 [Desulfobacterales bacterium]
MKNKTTIFFGITAIIFGCCYIYQQVYPHVAGQVLISFYSDIKMIMSGRVPDGYEVTQEQSAQITQFLYLTYVIKVLLALIFSALGAIGILQFQKRIKRT